MTNTPKWFKHCVLLMVTLSCWGAVNSQLVIVSNNAWKGVGNSTAANGTAWRLQGYNDAAWPFVEAPNAGNVIPVVGGSQSMWVLPYSDTAYMRTTFTVPVADNYTGNISINADNEFELWFNGTSQGFFNWWPSGPYNFNITPSLQGCVQNVIAVQAANWSGPYGASLNATININNPLNAPNALAATAVTCNSFTANWAAVPTADLYLLDVSTDPTFATFYSVYSGFNVGNVLSYNLTGLPGPGPYYYRLRAQRTNGFGLRISCYSNVITVNLAPPPAISAGPDAYVCPSSSTQLNGSGMGTPTWSGPGLSATNILNPTATPAGTTTYVLSIDNAGCISTDSVVVSIINTPPLVLSNDTGICTGACVNLTVAGGDYFEWSPFPGMLDSSLTTQNVCPATSTTYTVTAYTVGPNLITNGDFSAGNSGFSSSYNYAFPNTTEGEYYVGTNPSAWNGGLSACGDHTSGAGNMMMVNGSPFANVDIWCQTIPISPNTDYLFSTWVTPAYNVNFPALQFSINGTPLGSVFSPAGPVCTWEEFFTTWNSGVNTSATICIVNQNVNVAGNDFALDDISFSPVCTQTGTVDVTVNPMPAPVVNNTGPYCPGDNIQLSSPSGSATDDWTGPNGYTAIDTQNPTIVNATVADSGVYTVTVTVGGGCSATGTTTVIVNPAPVPVVGNDGPVCAGGTINLSSGGGNTYSWLGPNGYNDPANQNPVINNMAANQSGDYTVTITDVNNCSVTATTTVVVNGLPVVNANINTPLCDGQNINLTGGGATTYDWTGPNGFTAINDPAPVITNASTAYTGVYTVTGTDASGCSSTATVSGTVNPIPTPAFTPDITSGCTPLCVNFTDNSNVIGSTITTWNWNIESQPASSSQNASACFNNPGTYDVALTVTTSDGCSATLSLPNLITATATPVANFTYSPQLIDETDPTVNFANTSFAATSYLWDFGDGTTTSTTNPQHTYADTGLYCVNLIASNGLGCSDTAIYCLVVNPIFTIYIPNTFTPNEDGINNVWMVYGNGIQTLHVSIFNRWGQEIYQYSTLSGGWNGHMQNGSFCPQGTYVYRVEAVDFFNKEHQYTGKLNLIR